MTRQIKINQHYVPRFYLDNFADSERFNYVFDKQYRSIRRKPNKSLCSSDGYYDLPLTLDENNEVLFQIIENQLTKVETIGERMIQAILNGVAKVDLNLIRKPGTYKRLKGQQIHNLAGYIALQYLRTEAARELIRREHKATAHDFVKTVAERIVPSFDINKLEWKVNENWIKWYHILLMADFKEYIKYFEKKIFIIAINRSSQALVTSDNPIALLPHEYDQDPKLDSTGMRLIFPLSPKVAICMCEPRYWGRRLREWDGQPMLIEEDEVELFNEMQLLNSQKQIYGQRSQDLEFALELCQRYPTVFMFDETGEPRSRPIDRQRLVYSLLEDAEYNLSATR
jgi:Protein of unknown function (DUF4238)